MPENFENIDFKNNTAPWQQSGAFNTYWSYSLVNNSSFYAMINPQYREFMQRWVQNWLWWYDGWAPYFHSQDQGILSTRIGGSLVDRVAKKVAGGHIMFKNAGKEEEQKDKNSLNDALRFISGWAADSNFAKAQKQVIRFAAAAGTALIKLNKNAKQLWAQAVRFDRFVPRVDPQGRLIEVKCFLYTDVSLGENNKDGKRIGQSYNLVECRYFGDYTRVDGEIIKNVPIVEYKILRSSTTATASGSYAYGEAERIQFRKLPDSVRKALLRSYGTMLFDEPIMLPFKDSLGCELVTWTEGIGNLPQLPFGESFLGNIVSYLMSYDYYWSAFNTDMYTGRARVLVPEGIEGVGSKNSNYNSGLDSFMYTKVKYMNPDEQKPLPLQFNLRAEEWQIIRNTIIENIAVNTGLSPATIASFLNDNSARTAREVSTEENETSGYVEEVRSIVEGPINRLLKLVTTYYGYSDDVVIRWSAAGLTNRHSLTEIISIAKQSGFISKKKAVQMFNYDDDDEQVQEEFERIISDEKNSSFGEMMLSDEEGDYFSADKSPGDSS